MGGVKHKRALYPTEEEAVSKMHQHKKKSLKTDPAVAVAPISSEDEGGVVDIDDKDFLTEKESKKILQQAKEQQWEVEREGKRDLFQAVFGSDKSAAAAVEEEDEEEEEEQEPSDYEQEEVFDEFTEADRDLFEKWTKPSGATGVSLSELILKKLKDTQMADATPEKSEVTEKEQQPSMNPKVVEVYTKLGELLARYKSGKLPKAFKVIPALKNWQDILALTNPDAWTPHAVYQGTRLFSSTLQPALTQRYYSAILLPHVQRDLAENKKLNYHLFLALKKALYKPSAFFKGILIPICAQGEATLKEASILASVLAKASIPVLHASACILKISELPYSGANSIFLRTLLDKKFTLPYRVVDALVDHFYGFMKEDKPLFVLWHQSLLVFVERYKNELTKEQKSKISTLIQTKNHPLISPEIQKELDQSVCREDAMAH